MRKNSYTTDLTAISEGKNEEQIAERFGGNSKLVKNCIEALYYIHLITKNSFNELVLTPDGENYVEKFESER
jgi:hypothetical protein